MLVVKTRIGPSAIEGLGVFADQFIPKGADVWVFNPALDVTISADAATELPEVAQRQFFHYAYRNPETGDYVLSFDDSRFMNHSTDPNIIETNILAGSEFIEIAARDIRKGEELTCDYRNFDGDFTVKMAETSAEQYNVDARLFV